MEDEPPSGVGSSAYGPGGKEFNAKPTLSLPVYVPSQPSVWAKLFFFSFKIELTHGTS